MDQQVRHKQDDTFWLVDILLLTASLCAFYFLWLGTYALFTPDEGRYAEIAREMVVSNNYITPQNNGLPFLDKPIFHYWLQAIAMKFFGINEWAIRFFPTLFALLSIVVTYICTRILYQRQIALLASTLLATSPLYFICAHYADLNMEVACLIACSLFLFITTTQIQVPVRKYLSALMYICIALAFLTKGLIGIAFIGMIVAAWILLTGQWRILTTLQIGTGLVIFLLINVPWYYLAEQANPGFLNYFFFTQQVDRYLAVHTYNNVNPVWYYLIVLFLGFFPWSIFLISAVRDSLLRLRTQTKSLELFFLLWFFIILIFYSIPNSKIAGYLLPVFPPIAILVARYLITQASITSKWLLLVFTMSSLVLITTVCAFPFMDWFDFLPALKPYLIFIASLYSLGCVLAIYFLYQNNLRSLVTTLATVNIGVLLCLVYTADYLNVHSTKQLASFLTQTVKKEHKIYMYHDYLQDVPFYLQQPIHVVDDWQRADLKLFDNPKHELLIGAQFKKEQALLVNDDEFWRTYKSNQAVLVFISKKSYIHFKKLAGRTHCFLLARTSKFFLLSNQPKHLLA